MHKDIGSALKFAKNLTHVYEELIKLFEISKKEKGILRIGYVAGILTSDGIKHFERNRKRIVKHAEKLRKIHKFPMFCTVDVFSNDVYTRLEEYKLLFEEREERFRKFWRKILKSGHVTDVFMTPCWEKSKGASDEHKTAKKIGLTIHYVEDTH